MTKRDGLLVAVLYLLWLIAAYLINIFTTGARTPQDVFNAWVRFDGIYFRAIAEHGYAEASRIIRYQQGFPFLTALFPLFPLFIHVVAPIFGENYSAASVIAPQVLTLLALLALFKLIAAEFSRSVAWLTLLSLITFPTSYFLLASYSETLFLLLVVITFYFYRHRQFLSVGIVGAFAAAARIMGAPLLLGAFVLDTLYHAPRTMHHASRLASLATRHVSLILIPLGLLAYMLYLWWDFGNPLLFMQGHASSEWKVGFDLTGPVKGLLLPFYTLVARDWSSETFRANLFNSLFFYFAIVLAIYAWRKLPLSYSLYALLAIFVPTLSGSLISMPRYLLISFPLFLSMGLCFDEHPRLRVLLVPLALASLSATYLFFRTVFLG